MRTRIAAAMLGLALVGVPAAAQAKKNNGAPGYSDAVNAALKSKDYKPYEERYLRLYDRYSDEFGVREAGRNIVLFGVLTKRGEQNAPESEVTKDADTMESALNPAPVATTTESATTATATATPAYTSGTSSGTVACESGGDYSANTGNGYYGGYQFDSGTWDAYGDSQYAEASDAPPAVQDAAAASVPYDAWPNC
jgi:hypothetical protein